MFAEDLTRLVKEHYEKGGNTLLLSDLGLLVAESKLRPDDGDRRSLREIAEAVPDLSLISDEDSNSYIIVVMKGDEARAEAALVERHQRRFLRRLPRALLLAFTLDMADGQKMAVQLQPKLVFQGGPEVAEGWIEIDADLRLPGMDVGSVQELDAKSVKELESRIRAWCDRRKIDPESLSRSPAGPRKAERLYRSTHAHYSDSQPGGVTLTALERLYQAQEPEIARRMTIPIDIALVLTRMR